MELLKRYRDSIKVSLHIKKLPALIQNWEFLYKGLCLLVLHLHHTAEAREGHSKDAGGDERDGDALHRGGKLGARKLLADPSEDHEGEREAYRDGDGIDDTLQERVFLLDDEDGDPEDAAVCRNER